MGALAKLKQRSPWSVVGYISLCVGLQLSVGQVSADPLPQYRFVNMRMVSGPCCTDEIMDLSVDRDGNVLVAGYRGSIDVDGDGQIDLGTFGRSDVFVSLINFYNEEHTYWIRGPGGPSTDRAEGIASDGAGGAYVAGSFTEAMRVAETSELEAVAGRDAFVARYGKHNRLMWARSVGSNGPDWFMDVASDELGNVYAIGTVSGQVDVDKDGEIDVQADQDGQVLVVSYSPDGELRWFRATGGSSSAWGNAIAVGKAGEVYIGGWYRRGALDLDGDGEPDVSESPKTSQAVVDLKDALKYEYNAFYARLGKDGEVSWVKEVSGPSAQFISSLAIAGKGDLLVLGSYSAAPDFDNDGTADLEFRSMADRMWQYHGDTNSFLSQVTPSGELVWARRYSAQARHVAAHENKLVLSGAYSNDLDTDDDGVPERESDNDDQREGFSLVLDNQGNVLQTLTVVGDWHDVMNAAGFSPDGKVLYVAGHTSQGADFNDDGEIEVGSMCHKQGELFVAVFELDEEVLP
jgi:hypothetical protein